MRLTPLEIRQHKFRKTVWGYDGPEVDAFLDVLAHDFEQLSREIHGLRDAVEQKDDELLDYRERERALKETMITASRLTDDIKQTARKEADLVIAQAESQAEQIIQNAHTRLVRIIEDIDELRRQKAQLEATLRSTLMAHTKLIDALNERDVPVEAEMVPSRQRRATPSPEESRVVMLNDRAHPVTVEVERAAPLDKA